MHIRSRIAGLDGLRAIAVLAVIQQHFGSGVYLRILGAGSFAVRLFFVLSGFLITRILLAAREAPDLLTAWRAFVVRRTLRIFPAYYLILGIMVLCTPSLRQHWGWYTLYATNLYIGLRDAWPEVG